MKNAPKNKGKVSIIPLGDRILVRPLTEKEDEKTASGIYIPETAKEKGKFLKGEVVAAGNGWYQDGELIPLRVKVGDTVLYPTYVGDDVEIDGKEYTIIKEDSILAIIK
jgi:chaperonin GroES